MDGKRFDEIVKIMGKGTSRRGALKSLLGTALGGAAAMVSLNRAPAAEVCRNQGNICRKHGDCCTNVCGAADGTGRRRCTCAPVLSACTAADACCSGACENNLCCVQVEGACVDASDCCGTLDCVQGFCGSAG